MLTVRNGFQRFIQRAGLPALPSTLITRVTSTGVKWKSEGRVFGYRTRPMTVESMSLIGLEVGVFLDAPVKKLSVILYAIMLSEFAVIFAGMAGRCRIFRAVTSPSQQKPSPVSRAHETISGGECIRR
ncbi:MAG: hypothetical protein ACLUQ2_03025 [Klebsiella pneumoniae]